MWILCLAIALLSFGVEFFFIALTSLPIFYAFILKSLGIFACCIAVGALYVLLQKRAHPDKYLVTIMYYEIECLSRTKILLIIFITGIIIDLGIAAFILAQYEASIAGTSPGVVSAAAQANILIAFVVGRLYFKERTHWM